MSDSLLTRLRRVMPSRSGAGSGFEGQAYLAKWALLSTIIGIVAGLGAALFFAALQFATHLFLGGIGGYLPPLPYGEGGSPGPLPGNPPLLVPLVVALGGLISGIIVFNLAPEAEGHGTDAAIDAIHHKGGRVRARIPPIKLVASAITIGTGGSGGREGPAAQISAGFGSLLATWLRLPAQDRRIAVAAGMGAGIGAIFRAPLGGAVMAAEILYLHDLEVEAIIPGLIASIVGYSIFGAIYGFEPIFGAQPGIALESPIQLPYYAILGIACGLVGIVYAKVFYGVTDGFHRLSVPRWVKPAIGGLAVGIIGLVLPQVLHTGYGWVQVGMGHELLGLPLWLVLLLPFGKILATSLSIGSGGSGGIFGPGMVIGGLLGAAVWRLGYGVLPQLPSDPAPFVIVGMMALFGGIAHAPLAVMLMVAEMTGNLSLLAPAMIAVAFSTALVGDRTIYRSQLPNRGAAPAHRVRLSFPLLSSLTVRDAMTPATVVAGSVPVGEARRVAEEAGSGLILTDARGAPRGVVTPERLAAVSAGADAGALELPVEELLEERITVPADAPLDEALEALADANVRWAPVLDEGRLVGRLGTREVVRTYKSTLRQSVRRATSLPPETALFEVTVGGESPLVGRPLAEAGLPPSTLVVTVLREGEVIFPRATTTMAAGDRLTVLAAADHEHEVRSYFAGS
ncbi:MAG TPA: chloride channel protein [Candidatus Limnocylindria bacterium]|nr:chloride channel protein [Candidatus Limnocylindria bacterium]